MKVAVQTVDMWALTTDLVSKLERLQKSRRIHTKSGAPDFQLHDIQASLAPFALADPRLTHPQLLG